MRTGLLFAAAAALMGQQAAGAGVRAGAELSEGRELAGESSGLLCKWWKRCGPACPVIAPVEELDIDRFIEKTWFIQKQQPNPYQSVNQLFCVTATYNPRRTGPWDDGFLTVLNYANNDGVNGPPQATGGAGLSNLFSNLLAQPVKGGQLRVAPEIFKPLFRWLGGPYWVIAIADDYSWAIISGGQGDVVKQEDPTLCTTKIGSSFLDTNGSGLWLFTRDQVADSAVVAAMEQKLVEMGVSPADLIPVPQEGCNYEGASLKL